MALAESSTLSLADLPLDRREFSVTPYREWNTLEEQEREYIAKILAYTEYNIGQTAQILSLPRTTLWRKMRKYGLAKGEGG